MPRRFASARSATQRRSEPRAQRRDPRVVAAVTCSCMDADVQVQPDTIQRLRAAMVADPPIKIGSPIVVHAGDPATIQYAGGSLHFICEAINPWMDRPLAERGPAPRDIGVASTCGLLLDRAGGDRRRTVRRALLHRQGRRRLHAPHADLAGYRIRELPEALVLHHSRPRGDLAVLLPDPQPLALHAEELPVADADADRCRVCWSTSRCSSSCCTPRAMDASTGRPSAGCSRCCPTWPGSARGQPHSQAARRRAAQERSPDRPRRSDDRRWRGSARGLTTACLAATGALLRRTVLRG